MRRFLMLFLIALSLVWAAPVNSASVQPVVTDPASYSAMVVVDSVLQRRMSYLDDTRREALAGAIVREAVATNFDPLFVLAVMEAESAFDHEAVSSARACGLMQLLPATFREEVERSNLGRREKFNPAHNAQVGIRYLAFLAKTFTRPETVLMAYNEGPGGAGAVLSKRKLQSEESKRYIPAVMAAYRRFLDAHGLDPRKPRKYWRSPNDSIVRPPPEPSGVMVAVR